MRKLLKILFAAGVTALAAQLIRRLLFGEPVQAPSPEPEASRAAPRPRAGGAAVDDAAPASRSPSRDELYKEAARLDVKGRSKMNKRQLQDAVEAAKTGGDT